MLCNFELGCRQDYEQERGHWSFKADIDLREGCNERYCFGTGIVGEAFLRVVAHGNRSARRV